MVSRGTGPRSHGRVATWAAGGCVRLAVVVEFFLVWTLSTLRFGSVLQPWLESCSGSTAICMEVDWRTHPRRPVSRLGPGSSVYPCGNRRRRQPRDSRHRDWRRFSGCRRDCPKRERPSRTRAHHGGRCLGYRMHGCGLRSRTVADRGDRRCSRLRHSRVWRAFRESDRSALAVATDCGSAARHNAR